MVFDVTHVLYHSFPGPARLGRLDGLAVLRRRRLTRPRQELTRGVPVNSQPSIPVQIPSVWPGIAIGSFRVHYQNGEIREIPIRIEWDARGWWITLASPLPLRSKDSVVAWAGTNPARYRNGWWLALSRTGWENPLPDIQIKSIDYVSAMTAAALFLIAIKAEP